MLDPIYSLFNLEDGILVMSLLFNIGIAINYFEEKQRKRQQTKKVLASRQEQQALKAKAKRQLNNRIQRELIIKGIENRGY